MPTWLIIVILVFIVLAGGGILARRRQLARTRPAFERSLTQADHDLAAAAAADRGWDRARLEAAARRGPGAPPRPPRAPPPPHLRRPAQRRPARDAHAGGGPGPPREGRGRGG